MPEPIIQPSNRIPGADGMRAIACLWVFVFHLKFEVDWPSQDFFSDLLKRGNFGVPIFFVLSGMLLSLPFWKSYLDGLEMPSFRRYIVRRLCRIIPAYYACLLIMLLIHHRDDAATLLRSIAAFTFTNFLHWSTYFPVRHNAALWSINIEMTFYMLLPVVFWALFRLRRTVPAQAGVLIVMALLACWQVWFTRHTIDINLLDYPPADRTRFKMGCS